MSQRIALLLVSVCALTARAQDAQTPVPPPEAPVDESVEPEVPARTAFAGTAADLAASHPSITLRRIGASEGGRPIELLSIGAEDATWPALLVAGLHGRRDRDETRLALDVASWLAENAESLPRGVVFHVLADASPDAAAAAPTFARPGNDRPIDDDRDGKADEDGPDDVNGDGRITWMRVPDPAGAWKIGDDGRPLRAAPAKGVLPTHRIVPEGRDDDADGSWNEDGPGGVDISRNFTWRFREHERGAGLWPASESETRALLDFVLADQRIALVYEIGGDESVSATPAWNDVWPALPGADATLLDGLRELHGKGVDMERKPHAPGPGALGGCVWHELGRIWLGRAPLARSGPVWPDGDAAFPAHVSLRWSPVTGAGLPEGAEVATIEPAPDVAAPPRVTDETPSIGAFLRDAAAGRATLAFTETADDGSPGVLRLRTRIANTGRLPTHTERGAALRARRPLNVRIVLPEGATLAAGRPHTQIERLAGGAASDEMAWVVTGPSGAAVRIEVNGPDTGTIVLERSIP